jgi:hypothetical protein
VGESKVSRSENNYFAFIRVLHTNNQTFFSTSDTKMARLASAPKNTSLQNLPDNKKNTIGLAIASDNPRETAAVAARLYFITKGDSIRKAWLQERKRGGRAAQVGGGGGHNKILRPEQHQALIQYTVDQATNGGKGATKQMLYNCAMWLRV